MTRATLPENFSGIYVLTDKEYKEMQVRVRRDRMMDELMSVSKKPTTRSYSKSTPRTEPKSEKIKPDGPLSIAAVMEDIVAGREATATGAGYLEQLMWDKYLPDTGESVDDIADDNIAEYRFGGQVQEKPGTDYSDLYKKEIAMVSSILRDLNDIAKNATKQLSSYNRKGVNVGMSKTYADVLQAASATQKARLDAVKMISDLKAKQVDFTMKAKKDEPNTELTVDEQVAQFYAEVMNGGMNHYVGNATGGYDYSNVPPPQSEGIPFVDETTESSNASSDQQQQPRQTAFTGGFDLTRPLGDSNGNVQEDADSTGYISHEDQGVEVVLIKHSDGSYEFAAIDQDGNQVDDYELPGKDLLWSLSIPPLSTVAYDKYARRYRILDYENPVVQFSDEEE